MGFTAVIFTFHRLAVLASVGLALAVFLIAFALLRRSAHGWLKSALIAIAWFVIALLGVQLVTGIHVGGIEVVSYDNG
jgi:hypothetical protein